MGSNRSFRASAEKQREAITQKDILDLRDKLQIGDIVKHTIEVYDSKDERLLVPVRRNWRVIKKSRHGVVIAPKNGTESNVMVSYIDILMEQRARERQKKS